MRLPFADAMSAGGIDEIATLIYRWRDAYQQMLKAV